MNWAALAPIPDAIGPTTFAVLAWGSIGLVVAILGYVAWAIHTHYW